MMDEAGKPPRGDLIRFRLSDVHARYYHGDGMKLGCLGLLKLVFLFDNS